MRGFGGMALRILSNIVFFICNFYLVRVLNWLTGAIKVLDLTVTLFEDVSRVNRDLIKD